MSRERQHRIARKKPAMKAAAFAVLVVLAGLWIAGLQLRADPPAGPVLANGILEARWHAEDGKLQGGTLKDLRSGAILKLPAELFTLILKDGTVLRASDLNLKGKPGMEALEADPKASKAALRMPGKALVATLEDGPARLAVTWRALLRDGASYLRQEVTLEARGADAPIASIRLIAMNIPGAEVSGTVRGSPVTAGPWFLAFEHPLADNRAAGGRVLCRLNRELPVKAGQHVTYASVVGAARPGQMRRDFLAYLEAERAHPYRTFLHYNSWYDLGYFSKYDEAGALAVIRAFGKELTEVRGVKLDSFLFDDGWDEPSTLWRFHTGFPKGFEPLRDAAADFGASPGVWLSPWGGYGKPRDERLAAGRAAGFETNADGFALSGPRYFARFHETCVEMVRRFGINQFKFDGTGSSDSVVPGSAFGSDFEAALQLIADLRALSPDLFINLTTGTYPSPFWLLHADSIWRGGEDHEFLGAGTARRRWITYRDADTYDEVVQSGPLYPLNSLMLHGIIYAKSALGLSDDPGRDFKDEVRTYFGTGTQLQEMYITPALLRRKDWDDLAEAARWSRKNQGVLKDTHWIGGDPAMGEVYGWAAWAPDRGILTLRNPSATPRDYGLDAADAFELPQGAPKEYTARSPWKEDAAKPIILLRGGTPFMLHLAPFQVLTLEAVPTGGH
jgi:hypothetical protein